VSYCLHPLAVDEHLEQIAFYESRQAGLGARYLAAFEAAMQLICQQPSQFKVVREPGIRSCRLKIFPFSVIYRESASGVEVLAVSAHRRRPMYWVNR
jgi:toxin ParE1/3/4